jgi:hypothetical protein
MTFENHQMKSTLLPKSVRLVNGHYFTFHKNQCHLLASEEQACFDYMMMQFDQIIDQFIQINANQEINIPADMKQQLLMNAHQYHCYHPSLLAPAYTSILELLRISAFIPFITDPQRLALFSNNSNNLSSSCSSNFTFVSTSSSISTTSSLSSSTSLASSSPTVPRPSYFYRSSSNPTQPPPPILVAPSSNTWNLRRLKSSPSLNSMLVPSIPPLPPLPLNSSMSSTTIMCRSSTEDDTDSYLSIPSHRPCSTHSQIDSTIDPDDLDKPFLKKITSPFRRATSPQNRSGGWRQITVHDSPLFKKSCLVHQHPSQI